MHKVHWKLVAIDETQHWNKEFLARLGVAKVMAVYLFNALSATHCCELTPSYELWPVESHPDVILSDEMDEDFREADNGCKEITYMHCSRIQRLEQERPGLFHDFGEESVEDIEESLSDKMEYLSGNQVTPSGMFEVTSA
jgi:hypothetical protein